MNEPAESSPLPPMDRVVALVAQVLRGLESERDAASRIRSEVSAVEADWSAVERTALTLGRRRRTLEAPLPPLPEPRGAAATQNWLQQRRAQGSQTRAWIERLPALLALLRPIEPIEALGSSYPIPRADEERIEGVRGEVRRAIVRQDVPRLDALLPQLQSSLTQAGQRRTDILGTVDGRASLLVPALVALSQRDARGLVAVAQWQAKVRGPAAGFGEAVRGWDVPALRRTEAALNALADEVPTLRLTVEAAVAAAEEDVAAHEQEQRKHTSRLADLRAQISESSAFTGAVSAGWPASIGLGGLGVVVGLVCIGVVVAVGASQDWYGIAAFGSPIALGLAGAVSGLAVGVARSGGHRAAAAAEAAKVEAELERLVRGLAATSSKSVNLRGVLEWLQVPA